MRHGTKAAVWTAGLLIVLLAAHSAYPQHAGENITLVGRWANGPCRAVAVRDNVAFFNNGGYFEIVDFTDPAQPVELSKTLLPSFLNDITLHGNLAFLVADVGAFGIFDITDLHAPVELPNPVNNRRAKSFAAEGSTVGSLTPRLSRSPIKVDDQPEATALADTKYSSIRSQPMIQAIISPKAA